MGSSKSHLGDGVYVEVEDGNFLMSTEYGYTFLDPADSAVKLVHYMAMHGINFPSSWELRGEPRIEEAIDVAPAPATPVETPSPPEECPF